MKHLQKLGYIAIGSVLTLAVMGTALAATGALTIEVNPINVQVNGATFQPKDAAGKTVPVFAYNGTTYAPLRALAEAYGLKVGYDAATNMATVGETTPAKTPDTATADYSTWTAEEEKAYQEFKGMWEFEEREIEKGFGYAYNMRYFGDMNKIDFTKKVLEIGEVPINQFSIRLLDEMRTVDNKELHLLFFYGDEIGMQWIADSISGKSSSSFSEKFMEWKLKDLIKT